MRHLIVFIGVFGLLAIFGPGVNACTCARPGTPCESYGSADAVFVGTVTGERKENRSKNEISCTPVAYKFAVEHSYLGVDGTEIEVFTGSGGGDCGIVSELASIISFTLIVPRTNSPQASARAQHFMLGPPRILHFSETSSQRQRAPRSTDR